MIHDWNNPTKQADERWQKVEILDETLRDGLQGHVRVPTLKQKIEILHHMETLDIDAVCIGFPASGATAYEHTLAIAREISNAGLKISPTCLCRTVTDDINPILEISQKVGIKIEAQMVLGSSPIRQFVEKSTMELLLQRVVESVKYAVKQGLPVQLAMEDSTRSEPEVLRELWNAGIHHGAERIAIPDTVGHATPTGTRKIIEYCRNVIEQSGHKSIKLDWHGHNDRGFGVANAFEAVNTGMVDRIHTTALGIGERTGNTCLSQLLINLVLSKSKGYADRNLAKLIPYLKLVSSACGISIPPNYPGFGEHVHATHAGIHASAILKAVQSGHPELAEIVYSGVPASMLGLETRVDVGPGSGRANVKWWLEKHGVTPTNQLEESIVELAKNADHILSDEEIHQSILEAIS